MRVAMLIGVRRATCDMVLVKRINFHNRLRALRTENCAPSSYPFLRARFAEQQHHLLPPPLFIGLLILRALAQIVFM